MGEVVIAVYRPKDGRGGELLDLIRRHVPTLREERLATDRPVLLLRHPGDGSVLEIFEWVGPHSADAAHKNPRVQSIWDAMGRLADFGTLAALPGANQPFGHFEPLDGIVV